MPRATAPATGSDMSWDAAKYLEFKDARTQPVRDLVSRIDIDVHSAVDIGCGPGNSTEVLAERFPQADILGIDSSPEMIERAREDYPNMRFELRDATELDGVYDLVFSNACLQWIPEHSALLPKFMDHVSEGGMLAVQIPANRDEPVHMAISEMLNDPEWGLDEQEPKTKRVLSPEEYYDILVSCSRSAEVWEVTYHHPLPSHRHLAEWARGTRLRPYMDDLGDLQEDFFSELTERLVSLYPKRADGTVMLRYRRIFFTARR